MVQNPTFCPGYSLSVLNVDAHSTINHVHELQGVANSIGKMDAYLRLIQQNQVENYNEDMQALHDVLSGTALDLYKVVSDRNIPCTLPGHSVQHKRLITYRNNLTFHSTAQAAFLQQQKGQI